MTVIRYSNVKINEIASITGTSSALISRYLKNSQEKRLLKSNHRVIGLYPEAVESYLKHAGFHEFYMPSITLFTNLCGGVGKTSGAINIGVAIRRITDRKTPIIFIDADSQASLTTTIFGNTADDKENLLLNYFEGHIPLQNIITELNDNIYFIKSNLNQAFIEKILSKPKEIKEGMLNLYKDLYKLFGKNIKIIQDHGPTIGSLLGSSIAALYQLDDSIKKSIMIPMRSDKVSVNGANYIIQEVKEVAETFSFNLNKVNVHCYFSNIDRRNTATVDAFQVAKTKDNVINHLSSLVIRTCSEITKASMINNNVFSAGKNNNATEDYQSIMQFMFTYGTDKEK